MLPHIMLWDTAAARPHAQAASDLDRLSRSKNTAMSSDRQGPVSLLWKAGHVLRTSSALPVAPSPLLSGNKERRLALMPAAMSLSRSLSPQEVLTVHAQLEEPNGAGSAACAGCTWWLKAWAGQTAAQQPRAESDLPRAWRSWQMRSGIHSCPWLQGLGRQAGQRSCQLHKHPQLRRSRWGARGSSTAAQSAGTSRLRPRGGASTLWWMAFHS